MVRARGSPTKWKTTSPLEVRNVEAEEGEIVSLSFVIYSDANRLISRHTVKDSAERSEP